jgi:hypothetical protein
MNRQVSGQGVADAGKRYPVVCENTQETPLVPLWQAEDEGGLPHPQLESV